MHQHNKAAVAESFGKAAKTYDEVAHFQRDVGARLVAQIPDTLQGPTLDLGCGTGYFLPALSRHGGQELYAADLSWGMLEYVSTHASVPVLPVLSDGERLPFAAQQFVLVFSSLTIQWCNDLEQLFAEVQRVLRPGGMFVFSTLLDGTLRELKEAWRGADAHQHVNDFYDFDAHCMAAKRAGLQTKQLQRREEVLYYNKVSDLTRELKMLGAHNVNANRPKAMLGRSRMQSFVRGYERFRDADKGLPATYQVLQGVLVRE